MNLRQVNLGIAAMKKSHKIHLPNLLLTSIIVTDRGAATRKKDNRLELEPDGELKSVVSGPASAGKP